MRTRTNLVAQGGPLDGRAIDVLGRELRVLCGKGYGWQAGCGHEVMAWGSYGPNGVWSDPQPGERYGSMCDDCYWHKHRANDGLREVY